MDKKTLSQYGWCVVVIVIIVILLGISYNIGLFLTDFEFSALDSFTRNIDEEYSPPISSADHYYSSIALAVNDVNAGTPGENADTDKEHAVAGIIEGSPMTVVVLKDNKEQEQIAPSVDMTIDLNGKTISSEQKYVIFANGAGVTNITINGTKRGSTILCDTEDVVPMTRCVVAVNTPITINGGTYINKTTVTDNATAIFSAAPLTVNDVNIIVESPSYCMGIYAPNNQPVFVNSSKISADSQTKSYGILALTPTDVTPGETPFSVKNSTIHANGGYTFDGEYYIDIATGVTVDYNYDAIFENCMVRGLHSGVSSYGPLHINGGRYEGYAHGGLYAGGINADVHLKNATFAECEWYGHGDEVTDSNNAAMYIGGFLEESGPSHDMVVDVDNCVFESTKQAIAVRGPQHEYNNTLRISNSKISDGTYIRVDSPSHRVYFGQGNTFDKSVLHPANYCTQADLENVAVITSEKYDY